MEYYNSQFAMNSSLVKGDFVAIDFETVNVKAGGFFGEEYNLRVPCQIGLVVVENDIINEEKSLNINLTPIGIAEGFPINEYSLDWIARNTNIIDPEMRDKLNIMAIWKDYPTFDKIWNKIEPLLREYPVVAHMAEVERSTIVNACNHYGLTIPANLSFTCTKRLSENLDMSYFGEVIQGSGMRTLTMCCTRYGIDFSEEEHHDAYADAKATARLVLKMRSGWRPLAFEDVNKIELPDISCNMFEGKRVVFTGDFYIPQTKNNISYRRYLSKEERDTILKDWLKRQGASITKSSSINTKTEIVIVGEQPGWSKLKKVKELKSQGWPIEIYDQKYLNSLINNSHTNTVVDSEDVSNPFFGKRIYIAGTFEKDIKAIKNLFKSLGATIDNEVTRYTHYSLLGDNLEKQAMEKYDDFVVRRGYAVKALSKEDLENIYEGKYDGYYTSQEVNKDFHLSYALYGSLMIATPDGVNPFLEENIFVPGNLNGNTNLIAQAIGNIGAYANYELENESESDKTKPIILLSSSTLECLKTGTTDDVILHIERTYNKSKSDGFDYKFVSEDTLVNWIKQRCVDYGDTLTLDLLNHFEQSK